VQSKKNFSTVDHLVGNDSKEYEKGNVRERVSLDMQEAVEYEPHDEIKRFVQTRKDQATISSQLKQEGVREKIETPQYARYKKVVLPLTDEMVEQGLHAPISSSLRWLAEWAVYLLKRAHIVLKRIHGQVKRVFER